MISRCITRSFTLILKNIYQSTGTFSTTTGLSATRSIDNTISIANITH